MVSVHEMDQVKIVISDAIKIQFSQWKSVSKHTFFPHIVEIHKNPQQQQQQKLTKIGLFKWPSYIQTHNTQKKNWNFLPPAPPFSKPNSSLFKVEHSHRMFNRFL